MKSSCQLVAPHTIQSTHPSLQFLWWIQPYLLQMLTTGAQVCGSSYSGTCRAPCITLPQAAGSRTLIKMQLLARGCCCGLSQQQQQQQHRCCHCCLCPHSRCRCCSHRLALRSHLQQHHHPHCSHHCHCHRYSRHSPPSEWQAGWGHVSPGPAQCCWPASS